MWIAYDGTNYAGWQRQKNCATIQSRMEESLKSILGAEVKLICSGRTDSGVHAFRQTANFHTVSGIKCPNLVKAMNRVLPGDIRVMDALEVDHNFSARYSVKRKLYRYRIYTAPVRSPFLDQYTLFHPRAFDLMRARKALRYLSGQHDFTSFCSIKDENRTRVRTILKIRIYRSGDEILIDFLGNGFLYNMIRIIVGTLLMINSNSLDPGKMKDILLARDRSQAGQTAPAHGLVLVDVRY